MNRYIKYAIIVILLVAAVALVSRIRHSADTEELTLKDTPAVIEATRPIGILYLYSTETEDYAKESFWGSGIGSSVLGKDNGILKKKHDCVQVLRQKVSMTMDMDKVQYQPVEGTDTVRVCLTVSTWFKSDSESEESAVQYDSKPLIQRVERRIKARYDTPENHRKAEEKAKETIADFLKQCGKVAVFV